MSKEDRGRRKEQSLKKSSKHKAGDLLKLTIVSMTTNY